MSMRLLDDFKTKCACFYGSVSKLGTLRVVMTDGSSAMIGYRASQFLRKLGLGPIAAVVNSAVRIKDGCVIGRNADFQGGFVIMHPQGVIINGGVKGGRDIVVESGVVIGAARNGFPVKVPTLGDDVFVGAGAKILGDVHIGSHVRIGANAVVVKDVPDGATVVGVPGRVLSPAGHTSST
jgi:serine O-acetyltransferase